MVCGTRLGARVSESIRSKTKSLPMDIRVQESLIFSLSCDEHAVSQVVSDLYEAAIKCPFAHVSPPILFEGKEVIAGEDSEDPYRELKLDSYMFVKVGERGIAIQPLTILAFRCDMSNGKSFHIGLCKYPETVTTSDGLAIPVDDKDFWGWQSEINFSGLFTDFKVDSESVRMMLAVAEKSGALLEILHSRKESMQIVQARTCEA